MVQTAWPCLGLAIERLWLALGGLFLATFPGRASIYSVHGLFFSAKAGWHFQGDLIASSLIGGCAYKVTYLLGMAEITCESSFKPNNVREQNLGYI